MCGQMRSNDKLKTYLNYDNATVTKLVRVVIYRDDIPPIDSYDP